VPFPTTIEPGCETVRGDIHVVNTMKAIVQDTVGSADALELREIDAPEIGDGRVTPVIDRTYPLSEAPEAIRYLAEGHARGKVVITV